LDDRFWRDFSDSENELSRFLGDRTRDQDFAVSPIGAKDISLRDQAFSDIAPDAALFDRDVDAGCQAVSDAGGCDGEA
jgi:hypothetical protein